MVFDPIVDHYYQVVEMQVVHYLVIEMVFVAIFINNSIFINQDLMLFILQKTKKDSYKHYWYDVIVVVLVVVMVLHPLEEVKVLVDVAVEVVLNKIENV